MKHLCTTCVGLSLRDDISQVWIHIKPSIKEKLSISLAPRLGDSPFKMFHPQVVTDSHRATPTSPLGPNKLHITHSQLVAGYTL